MSKFVKKDDISKSDNCNESITSICAHYSSYDILADNSVRVNKKFVLEHNPDSTVDKKTSTNCKILTISSKWNLNRIMHSIDGLDPKEYTNLFIFIIELRNIGLKRAHGTCLDEKNNEIVENIKRKLNNFAKLRPAILQIKSKDECINIFYYKENNMADFRSINMDCSDFEGNLNFESFFCFYLSGKFENFEDIFLKNFPHIDNSALILRFLKVLEFRLEYMERLFDALVLQCAACGSISDFAAIIDATVHDQRMLSCEDSKKYLCSIFENKRIITTNQVINSTLETSVLLEAVINDNRDIINYFQSNWPYYIQHLPFEHLVKISTTAFMLKQFDVLSYLINYSNFPFPDNIDTESYEHEDLKEIVDDRREFKEAILSEDFDKIMKFTAKYTFVYIGYTTNNVSALKFSILSGKYRAYFHIKSCGFENLSFEKPEMILNKEQLRTFKKFVRDQRHQNVANANIDANSSILLLCLRSRIHKRVNNNNLELKYREKIRSWYEDINKIRSGKVLLDVVASCENLKIIFDFESKYVDDISLSSNQSYGSMFGIYKYIFIGAKFLDKDGNALKQHEQHIKGVIAHELCHYAMRLVFENEDFPYYKSKEADKTKIINIVEMIDIWSLKSLSAPQDGCDGIISSVFTRYTKDVREVELIVRVVHILATYDFDVNTIKYLENNYKLLFDFWFDNVVPELSNFFTKNREKIREFNKSCDVLPEIINQEVQFSNSKNIEEFIYHRVTVISSNSPKLFLCNIQNYMLKEFDDLFDAHNIFINSTKTKQNSENIKDLQDLLLKKNNLNIFIDCSNDPDLIPIHFIEIAEDNQFIDSNFFFIVSNKIQQDNLKEKLNKCQFKPELRTIDYNWNDLSAYTQKSLAKANITFQNNPKISIIQLFKETTDPQRQSSQEQQIRFMASLSEVIDSNLLNILLDKKQITVNKELENDSDKDHFSILYQTRHFIKKHKESKMKQKLQYAELLTETRNNHFILISDSAGTGKSWVMKKLKHNFLTPDQTKWVTYVDLKEFVVEFKAQIDKPDFPKFMVEKILKLVDSNETYEANFYKRLYKSGKVIALFDGFDEIAPDCAEVVSQLAQSFKSNGGNQLWIATRDYFEVDLQSKLQVDVVYGLDEFTADFGIDLIATSWIIKDLENQKVPKYKLKEKVQEEKENSFKFAQYKMKAQKIVNDVQMLESRTVGFAQLFKMIIDLDQDSKVFKDKYNGYIVYEKIAQKLNKMWTHEKGDIRKEGQNNSELYDLTFFEYHELSAIESYFPNRKKICEYACENRQWPVEEIVACAVMTKKGDKYRFLHETSREFFASRFIVKQLKKAEYQDFYEIFVVVLTRKEFVVVRMFLNDAVSDSSSLNAILPEMHKYLQKFYEMDSFGEFFSRNLRNLTGFILAVLKSGDYEAVKMTLSQASQEIATKTTNVDLFRNFQDFIIDFLKDEDFKDLILYQEVFQGIVQSSLNIEAFENFVTAVSNKTSSEFVKKCLKFMSEENLNGNIFDRLCWSSEMTSLKVQRIFKIFEKYILDYNVLELMKKCNKNDQNILHVVTRTGNNKKLLILWTEIEKIFGIKNLKELATNEAAFGRNILHYAAYSDEIDFHETFWTLLMKTFADKQELRRILINSEHLTDNFTFYLIESKKSAEIIEMVFKKLKDKFTKDEFEEILKSKDQNGRNLLQIAAVRSTDIKTHQFLWKTFEDLFKNGDELHKILNQVDNEGCNLLVSVLSSLSFEVFEFTIDKIESTIEQNNMKNYLRIIDKKQHNLLQLSVMVNESTEYHEKLWKIFHKHLNQSELSEMIKNVNEERDNVLFIAIRYATREIIELVWKEIRNTLIKIDQGNFLQSKGKDGKNLIIVIADRWLRPEIRECIQNILQESGL